MSAKYSILHGKKMKPFVMHVPIHSFGLIQLFVEANGHNIGGSIQSVDVHYWAIAP
ncbi:hypothetical protein LguiA_002626 [Lonicera macranthoides]